MVYDSNRDLKDVFKELFELIQYEYSDDYPKKFRMHVQIIDAKEQNLPWNTITGFYEDYEVDEEYNIEFIREYFIRREQ